MRKVLLDFKPAKTVEWIHEYLKFELEFNDYYGNNLDALYDLLTERAGPTRIVIRRGDTLVSWLGDYGKSLIQTMLDADRANPGLEVLFDKDE